MASVLAETASDLEELFHPKAVALLGSVNRNANPEKLRRSCNERWGEHWYLVNPKGGSVGDIQVYEHVTDVPGKVTLAVISVGARFVPGAVEDCGRHAVPFVLIFTAGFSEVGGEGTRLEREIAETARRYGIRVLGPNTNTNAFEKLPEPAHVRGGRIGLITQSGHQGRPLVQSAEFGFAFSRWVPTGNEVDLEAADFIEYFAKDPDTRVIAGYFEGFRNPAKLRHALEATNAVRKPVVALKMGASEAGTRMSISHTGHLVGSDAVTEGLFAQYGVVRVRDLDELLETAGLFAKLPPGTGSRCALYSISGGSGTLMAEVAELCGAVVPELARSTREALRELIPDYLTVSNPVDNGAQFLLSAPAEERKKVLDLIASDPATDVVVVGMTGALGAVTDRFAEDIVAFADDLAKPVVVTWNSFKADEDGFRLLAESGLPLFRSFRGCFSALAAFARYQEVSKNFRVRKPLDGRLGVRARSAIGASEGARGAKTEPLPVQLSRELLESFGIPLVEEGLADSARRAALLASQIGFPVTMKIASVDFPHRFDSGLVRLGVSTPSAARGVYDQLVESAHGLDPKARIEGVEVQKEVQSGTEMIVGIVHDSVFGPSVLVGTGGVFTEVLSDSVVRPLPLDRRDAEEMVRSLRGHALLSGARGRKRADTRALVDLIMRVARLATACGEWIRELDLNPVIVYDGGAVAVDWLVVPRADGREGDSEN
jgi:acetate---CoA ligase (ADP-forming)